MKLVFKTLFYNSISFVINDEEYAEEQKNKFVSFNNNLMIVFFSQNGFKVGKQLGNKHIKTFNRAIICNLY